jgi:glycosyltransferase involved in cell wall biosynthesis
MEKGHTENRTVLIPAFEPDEKLTAFEKELSREGADILVVDDGSGPGYREIFEESKPYARVISYEKNRGKGFALKTGLRFLSEHGRPGDIIVTADADGQHRTKDVMKAMKEAYEHPGCLILGCRNFTGKVPLRSRLGNGITKMVFRMSSGVAVSDTQTGLRAFRSDMIPFLLSVPGDRYEYEMNMLTEAAEKKIPIGEVKIDTVYLMGNRSSHFNTLRDSFLIYRDLLKFAAVSLASFFLDYGMFLLFSFAFSGFGAAVGTGYANVCARVVSAGFNYTMNRKYVFRDHSSPAGTLAGYIALAAAILLFNTVLLEILVNGAGMNRYAAKIITEFTFFILSFITQKFIIFRKGKGLAA